MWPESEIQNCKKNFLDEERGFCQNDEAEKAFDEYFEKLRNLYFSELHDEKAIDKIFEKLEIPAELAAYAKDNLDDYPALSPEECFRNGLRLGKEFYRTEQKAH